jgi:broad specificity phosphatase PhoE
VIVGLRHAIVLNPDHVVYALLPGFHLSAEGRRDAERLAERMSAEPVIAVYASPLERAVETAEILAAPHGLTVHRDPRLLEWSFWARWQGMPCATIRDRDPDLLEAYAQDPTTASPADTLEAAGRRILAWAAEAEALHDAGGGDRLVLGITHEAPLLAATLVGTVEGLSAFHSRNLPHLARVRLRPPPAEPLTEDPVSTGPQHEGDMNETP